MKNSLLAILAALALFLFLYAIGAFNYGSLIGDEGFRRHAEARRAGVARTPGWQIALVGDFIRPGHDHEVADGVIAAVNFINRTGGVLGREINLQLLSPENDLAANRLLTEEQAKSNSIALLIGAMKSEQAESTRALTQRQALPMVTPAALHPGELPPLAPDLFVSTAPPPEVWSAPILRQLTTSGIRKVLVITPEEAGEGAFFALHLESVLGRHPEFTEIFRCGYTYPARVAELENLLRQLHGSRLFEAILFTGPAADLEALGTALRASGVRLPVFGAVSLDTVLLPRYARDFPNALYYPRLTERLIDEGQADLWKTGNGTEPTLAEQSGMLAVSVFREALESLGAYEPAAVGRSMRQILAERLKPSGNTLRATLVKYDGTPLAHD